MQSEQEGGNGENLDNFREKSTFSPSGRLLRERLSKE